MLRLPEFLIDEINSAIKRECGDVEPDRNREYGYALTEISKAALEYAEKNDGASKWGMSQLLRDSFYALSTVRRGARVFGDLETIFNKSQFFWFHRKNIIDYVKGSKQPKDSSLWTIVPLLSSDVISDGVGLYLDLPIRSVKIDRLFVDILIASKVWAFLNII